MSIKRLNVQKFFKMDFVDGILYGIIIFTQYIAFRELEIKIIFF